MTSWPVLPDDEREKLIAFLDLCRQTVLVKTDGLHREALVRRVVPSHTTPLGVIKHLTQVELWYFGSVFGGEPPDPDEGPTTQTRTA